MYIYKYLDHISTSLKFIFCIAYYIVSLPLNFCQISTRGWMGSFNYANDLMEPNATVWFYLNI